MTRKRVKTETIQTTTPKKRVSSESTEVKEKKETPVRWNKIKGVKGKIVRYSISDEDGLKEISDLVSKKKAKRLYCAADGEQFYFYFELLN